MSNFLTNTVNNTPNTFSAFAFPFNQQNQEVVKAKPSMSDTSKVLLGLSGIAVLVIAGIALKKKFPNKAIKTTGEIPPTAPQKPTEIISDNNEIPEGVIFQAKDAIKRNQAFAAKVKATLEELLKDKDWVELRKIRKDAFKAAWNDEENFVLLDRLRLIDAVLDMKFTTVTSKLYPIPGCKPKPFEDAFCMKLEDAVALIKSKKEFRFSNFLKGKNVEEKRLIVTLKDKFLAPYMGTDQPGFKLSDFFGSIPVNDYKSRLSGLKNMKEEYPGLEELLLKT